MCFHAIASAQISRFVSDTATAKFLVCIVDLFSASGRSAIILHSALLYSGPVKPRIPETVWSDSLRILVLLQNSQRKPCQFFQF